MKAALCSATGNTFLFLPEEALRGNGGIRALSELSRPDLARKACHQWGSGADGFIVVSRSHQHAETDFYWDFFNKDGSSAEMCGNAARCMAFYVRKYLDFRGDTVRFQTLAGNVHVKFLSENSFSVKMPEHELNRLWAKEALPTGVVEYSLINTGVPHAVIKVSDLSRENLRMLAKHFRFHPSFGSAGANVSFYDQKADKVSGVTFERGVEDFTASCGTGVVAMALAIFNKTQSLKMTTNSIEIQTPGGVLKVELDGSGKFCWLKGPAQLDEEIQLY